MLHQTDRSFAAKQRCTGCRKRTEHFGLMSPEGRVLFFICTRCGSFGNMDASVFGPAGMNEQGNGKVGVKGLNALRKHPSIMTALAAGALLMLLGAGVMTFAKRKESAVHC
jgi:hypothetical protein